jgi:membrane-bound ClpP family serine protease
MLDALRSAPPARRPFRWSAWCGAALALVAAGAARAEGPAEDGQFITVPNPIDSGVFSRVKEQASEALARPGSPKITKLIFDFNPDNKDAGSPYYGSCLELAEYIRSLPSVTTVAYVHARTTRHTVLPVLACKDLVMSDNAALGDVFPDDNDHANDSKREVYAATAGPAFRALALKMLDRNVEVWKGRLNGGVVYFDGRKADAARAEGVTGGEPVGQLTAGSSLFPAKLASELGLCKFRADSRQAVAEAYELSPASLRDDPLQGREPKAWRIELHGQITGALAETVQRRLDRAVSLGANTVIVQIDCNGGDASAARRIADYLRNLKTDGGEGTVRTIAFINGEQASDLAAFIAFGCTERVMSKGAILGDFTPYLQGLGKVDNKEVTRDDAIADSLAEVAEERGISPLIARGLVTKNLVILRVRGDKGGPANRQFVSEEEFDAKHEKEGWADAGKIKSAGQLLKLTASLAKDVGVARHVTDKPGDLRELCALYGIDPDRVKNAEPDWLDKLGDFLRQPAVAVILVMLGIGCLILELKVPGFGIPGVIAALCFVLFFWAQSQMSGQIIYLAVLLFVLGLVLIGIEIFLLPGFGVTGISGVVLVVAGLGLATVQKMPTTTQEWVSFGNTVTQFGAGFIAASIGAVMFARYLPNIPYANRLVLQPPGGGDDEFKETPPLPDRASALLGTVGVTATPLRPSGMAQIGDEYVDVITDGSFIPAGTRIQVIEVDGNRVVVKEV